MEHIPEYLTMGFAIFGALVAAASTIVKLTPSVRDDEILAKIVKVFDALSVFNPKIIKA